MKVKSKSIVFLFLIFISFSILSSNAFAKNLFEDKDSDTKYSRSAEAGFAEEEFRRGVQSYYRGLFNDAINQFERALSYLPEENLIIDWLGKAYYRAGMEGDAIKHWQYAKDAGYGGLVLDNRIEVVRERRVTGVDSNLNIRYTETGSFSGINKENKLLFSQPISVLPNYDGTIWVLTYGSNELLLFDINGTIIKRVTGPLVGFDRPVDIMRLNDGDLLVCESAGDRLAVLSDKGSFKKYIGKKGRGLGELVGPQYACQDENGNIYVSDFGNSRITVFDKEGNGIFNFGSRTAGFDGLKGPTGIACSGESIYVCDSVKGAIYEFDLSGNYRDMLVKEKTFDFPESMKFYDGYLIVSDRKHVSTVETGTGIVFENAYIGNAPSRITCAVPDKNGNIIVSDFKTNEVYIMAKMSELIGGLFVQIERVYAEKFPEVTLEVRVQNRKRQPVVGLKAENFYLTEDKRPCGNVRLTGAASENENEDIVIVIDRSMYMADYDEALNTAIREIASNMQGVGNISVISAGQIPVIEYQGKPEGLLKLSSKALKAPLSKNTAFDLSVRLATNELINAEPKRGIIYVTQGRFDEASFARYGISDLTTYMNNNGVTFSVIQLENTGLVQELNYMVNNVNGKSYYVYRPQGLSCVIKDMLEVPNGLYSLSYTSVLPTDLGRAFLPVEVETYILNRSGRDETGYFSPLN
ncbi:hypothetical protein [Treponema sp.]|uniref:hypothetical protein n=1 Tax=Treponema sp. TaxID=166 RepID=UPI00298DD973|nr:hypothetical protein [Treponema sp.]